MRSLIINSWNACLGVFHKIHFVKDITQQTNPDIFFIQEAEINAEIDDSLLKLNNYTLYKSENTPKSKLICYIHDGVASDVITCPGPEIILVRTKTLDIFGLYRPFKMQTNMNHLEYLRQMILFIQNNKRVNSKLIIIGDLNLDINHTNNPQHPQSRLFNEWKNLTETENLTQLVQQSTWTRTVNNTIRESILDHIYQPTSEIMGTYKLIDTNFSDHKLVVFNYKPRGENFEKNHSVRFIRT